MLIASARMRRTPWRSLLIAAAATLALPSALGAVMMALVRLTHPGVIEGTAAALWQGGAVLLLSPMLAGAGMIMVLPLSSYLLRLGWFGWVPAGLLGLGIGAAVGALTGHAMAAPFGLLSLLILRAVLGRLCPQERTRPL